MRPIQATIHLSALAHNLHTVKQRAPQSKVMAVVKANGYGHGLLNVAKGLQAADGFAVLGINEAVTLRDAGYSQTLLLLEGVFEAQELHIASQHNIAIGVHHQAQIAMLQATTLANPLHVHLKMNTGMHRLGFAPADYFSAYQALSACPNVASITLMTHFANADTLDGVATPAQLFAKTCDGLDAPRSLANSAAIVLHPNTHTDWVRPGIMLYGATPIANQSATSIGLKPVMHLHSEIISIQHLQAGESLGYGSLFTADKAMRVGTVACGYADGYPRHALTGTPIAVSGIMTRTLGRVSMDMLAVDLSHIPQAEIGSPVELWGEQVPVDAVAKSAGTIGYELLCAVTNRVPFKVVN